MIKVKEAVIVEGRYDKIRLASLIDGLIITTDGFGIFKNKEKMQMLRRLAETRGLLIITDSDSAGFIIRNYLKSCIPARYIKHAYIPDVFGKERRKASYSREGKIGVEGMSTSVLVEALEKAGVVCDNTELEPAENEKGRKITRQDFFRAGLSGSANSSVLRAELIRKLGLPSHMTTNALLGVINDYMTWEQFTAFFNNINK